MFKKVIIVSTGAGIGPVLAVTQNLHTRGTEFRIIWSVKDPLDRIGYEIYQMVKDSDPGVLIVDRDNCNNLCIERLAFDSYKKEGAEAIFVLSNPMFTKELVYALECRGVPTFGPIWDS